MLRPNNRFPASQLQIRRDGAAGDPHADLAHGGGVTFFRAQAFRVLCQIDESDAPAVPYASRGRLVFLALTKPKVQQRVVEIGVGTLGDVGPAGRAVCFIDDQSEAIAPGHAAKFDGQHGTQENEPRGGLKIAWLPDEGAPGQDSDLHSSRFSIASSSSL